MVDDCYSIKIPQRCDGKKEKISETDSIVLLVLISCKAEARGRYKLTNTARRTVIWTMNKNIQLKEPVVVAVFC